MARNFSTMKKIGNIRKVFLTRERIMLCIEDLTRAAKQRKWSSSMRQKWMLFLQHYDQNVNEIYYELRYQTWKADGFNIFYKNERGKLREIYASNPKDQVIDALLTDCLKYVFIERKKCFHPNAYGSIPGRGQHKLRMLIAKKVMHRTDLYVLTADTKKFYPTINHDKMMQHCRMHIKCEWLLWMIEKTIKRIGSVGIALGLSSSNILGHVYHSEIDWKIAINYKVRRYYRFCDDKYVIHRDKNYLHTIARELNKLTEDNCQIIKRTWCITSSLRSSFQCLGARISSSRTRLLTKGRRRIERIMKGNKEGEDLIRSWSGVMGGLKGMNLINLFNFWKNEYREFFDRLRCSRAASIAMREYRKWYSKMEIILQQAEDCRCEVNRRLYPIG